MKRSRYVGILALSVSMMALAGCKEEQDTVSNVAHGDKVFASLEACLADVKAPATSGDAEQKAVYDEQRLACISDWDKAKAEHEKSAPRFASLAECQAEFGTEACDPAPTASSGSSSGGSDSFFMPFMMGYMLSNAMSPSYPVYQDRSGSYRSTGNLSSPSRDRLRSTTAFVTPQGRTTPKSNLTSSRTSAPKAATSSSTRSRSSGFGANRSSGSRSFGG